MRRNATMIRHVNRILQAKTGVSRFYEASGHFSLAMQPEMA
jgi:hypothetical protein